MTEEQVGRTVYLLWHSRPLDDHPESPETDDKLLGVFESSELAEEAKAAALLQPGFRDWPDFFEIAAYVVNLRLWSEGFGVD